MWTRRLLASMLIGLALSFATGAVAKSAADAESRAARALVQHIADEAGDILKRKNTAARQLAFRKLFEESFNAAAIGRFVLGRYREGLTAVQFERFMDVFRELVGKTTALRLANYAGETLKILDVKAHGAHWTVASQVTPKDRSPIRFDWIVARAKGGPKVVDLRVENLSLAITERDAFAAVLRDSGGRIERLIAFMQDKIDSLESGEGPHASAR